MANVFKIVDRKCYVALMTGLLMLGIAQPVSAFQEDQTARALSSAREKQRLGQYALARNILLKRLSETPESPSVLDALGSVQQDMGEDRAAEDSYRHAFEASARNARDIEKVIALNNLGTLYLDTGQYRKAQWVRKRLEKLPPSTFETQPLAAARLFNVLGSLEHASKRDGAAERYYRLSLELLNRNQQNRAEAALVKSNLGFLRLEAAQYESARDLFQQVIQELETTAGPNDRSLLRPLINLARCENITGHPERAEPLARHALNLSDGAPTAKPDEIASALLEQAKALRQLGRTSQARDLDKQAKTLLETSSATMIARHTVSMQELGSGR